MPTSKGRKPVPKPEQSGASQLELDAFARLGVELWRLEMRCRDLNNVRIEDSLRRLNEAFSAAGGRVDDPVGARFVDGTVAEILHQPVGGGPTDVLFVTETIRPAVFVLGRCRIAPQVILGAEGSK